jgi:hypothetical protein
MNESQISILETLDANDYYEVLHKIDQLSEDDQNHGRMIIAKADAHYELKNDIEALSWYLKYYQMYPNGGGVGFAFFGAAVCLKNLELQQEAYSVLQLAPQDHLGLQKEIEDSKARLAKQKQARDLLVVFNQ